MIDSGLHNTGLKPKYTKKNGNPGGGVPVVYYSNTNSSKLPPNPLDTHRPDAYLSAMKLLHTADWHLGKRLGDYSRLAEQRAVLDEICAIAEAEAVDAVLIAGDLFDTFNPPNEALELFYRTVHRLSSDGARAVIAIAGNHDSPDRVEAPDPLARECGIFFVGRPASVVPTVETNAGIKTLNAAPGFVELQLPNCPEPLRLISNSLRQRNHPETLPGR